MPVHVTRVEGEPILIATFTGKVTVEDVREMFRQSLPLMEGVSGHIYRITDARETDTTFSDLVFILSQAGQGGGPGSTLDPRISPALVGSNQWVKMLASSLGQQQYGSLKVPLYETLEEALAYAREQIAAHQQAK